MIQNVPYVITMQTIDSVTAEKLSFTHVPNAGNF